MAFYRYAMKGMIGGPNGQTGQIGWRHGRVGKHKCEHGGQVRADHGGPLRDRTSIEEKSVAAGESHVLAAQMQHPRDEPRNYSRTVGAGDTAAASESADKQKSTPKRSSRADKPTKPKRKFPYRKVADIEAEIFQREQRLEQLHADLATPEALRDGQRVRQLQADIAAERAALEALYPHWEEASELN